MSPDLGKKTPQIDINAARAQATGIRSVFAAPGLIVGGGFKERLGSDSFQKHSVLENLLKR